MSTRTALLSTIRPMLQALGDETRFAVYSWLRERGESTTIGEISDEFDLHPNTVRPHLERLRDAGLVRLDASPRGGVGRPQHRYTAVPTDVEANFSGDPFPLLARMLAGLCCRLKVRPDEAVVMGIEAAMDAAVQQVADSAGPEGAVVAAMERLGFGPVAERGCVVFTQCPFRALAEEYPHLVCSLHEGLVTGVAMSAGGRLGEFHDLHASEPCMAFVGE